MKKRAPRRGVKKPSAAVAAPPATVADRPLPIVGIGASAGGLEALEQFLKGVPAASGMAFVVVQHLDPSHKDLLVELLQRITPLPVVQISDRIRVEPDHVYVLPPNCDLSILHGVLHLLEPAAPRGLRLPIDFFFRSLAADRQAHSLGVILSGMGADGTQGLRAIKEQAGAGFVQSPETAKFDSMPQSAINAGLADVVAPAEELAERIIALLKHVPLLVARPEVDRADTDRSGLDKVIVLLRAMTGHDFSLYKKSTIYRRIERRMGLHQLAALPEYVRYLRENPQEGELLFKELLIGVTRFFRDPAVWEQLKTDVLPALLAEYPNGGALRAWVPACSTGEEAYSLAIAFREVLEQEKPEVNYSLQIFATDLFKEAIDKARTGAYPANITADVTEPRLRRYFSKAAHGYRVSKEIREMVIFAPQNVTMDPPFTKLDLLLCRNLLIYFEKDLQAKLLPLFHRSLNAGGVLVLGNAETVGQATDLFAPLPGKTRIFRRNEAARAFESVDFPEAFARRRTTGAAVAAAKAAPAPNVQALTESLLLKRYSPVAVLVTDKGDIVYVSGKTGKYLEPATGKANLNLFAMAREGLAGALNEAFARAVRQQATVVLKELTVGSDGGATTVDVTVQPLDDPAALRGMVLVVFSDVDTRRAGKASGKAPGKAPGKGPDKAMPAGASADRIRALTEEIQESREELQTTREEMLTSQEELKSTNEELQSTNEELQSTNEEQTTSKEEMQSMNEELQTVNHELTAKVDALSHASDDMANLLDSTDIATLFLDGDMKVRQFTTQTSDIIKLIPGDAGRPITDLATTLDYPTLADDAREVLRTLVFCEVQVSTRDARWFRVRTMPYRTQDDRIDGVVITFTDISVAKALEATLREAQSVLQSRFTDQTAELDTAKALEGVLQRAQALLEKRVTAQTLELRESRGDVEAGPSGSLQKEPRP